MGVDENRIANLKALVNQLRGQDKPRVAYNEIAAKTGLNAEYLYQLYTDRKRVMGRDAARAIDRHYADGRPTGWFDLEPSSGQSDLKTAEPSSTETSYAVAAAVERLASMMKPADDMTRDAAVSLLSRIATHPEESPKIASKLEALLGPADTTQRARTERASIPAPSAEPARDVTWKPNFIQTEPQRDPQRSGARKKAGQKRRPPTIKGRKAV